ncbi:hypothetical protein IQ241_25110 [Romeria aff. gracilis LEGE 07310]|uniref:Secreted protein n=1 Tax=Vasconcelosia minhoensis LEGE 07310 TaxID=915328 RepID=A0A8J7ATB1_9CYAN|nr:hypothetical protein [Romeria gracilis]MBE9080521.1 hypothetical protein [Romeria aff. gracilis LEGE 07310]
MVVKHIFRRASAVLAASSIFMGGMLAQGAKAEWYRPLHAGRYDWVRLNLDPGTYTVRAYTLGDVDIALYDASKQTHFSRIRAVEADGYDTMRFEIGERGVFNVKYSMVTCLNPWGPCGVNIDLIGPT